ncbi:TnsA endonuclease N-terminal domain-containing protein [Candidatus Pacearchaeota archaeon]|nr:TnsA endonuclease N-terminal domain-containing protein [Candidatus Pacearchaeota archaeon]
MIKKCEHCTKEYRIKPSKAERSHYCSKDCHNKGQKGMHRSSMHTCPQCAIEFKPTNKKQICCSKECHSKRKDFPCNKAQVCAYCNEEFYASNQKRKYCTPRCYMLDRMSNPEELAKLGDRSSKLMTRLRIENGGKNPYSNHYNTGYHYSPKNQEDIWYDSSYELQAYKLLDQLSIVKSYSRCNFCIEYEIDKKTRRYIPDILVTYNDNTHQVIEIKPERLVEDEVNQAKFASAKTYCAANDLDFVVWTENKLFD